jgi:hypothetical protein
VPAIVLLSGCYLDHGLDDPPPPASDGGTGTEPPTEFDAGPPPVEPPYFDAGPIPEGCVPAPLDFACTRTETGMIPVGVAHDLPVYFGDVDRCYCGEQIRCEAHLAPDGAIELYTSMCSEFLCDGCFPHVEGSCRLPPLAAGIYDVRVLGDNSFRIEVSDATPVIGPIDHCSRYPRDSISCGWQWPPSPEQTDQLCVPAEVTAGSPIYARVDDFCAHCGMIDGPCRVTRTASSIHVQPMSLASSCDVDCTDECSLEQITCVIPPLEAGTYTVTLEGIPGAATMVVHDPGVSPGPGNSCVSVPED